MIGVPEGSGADAGTAKGRDGFMRKTFTWKKIHIVGLLFCIGVFLKQFYLASSGSVQISDMVIAASVLAGLVMGLFRIYKIDWSLIVFVALAFVVNVVYFIIYRSEFLRSSLYMVYNLLVVIIFRTLAQDDTVILFLRRVFKLNLLTQLVIFLIGFGEYYGPRYQGTFNDPNQYGFFILMDLFLLVLCSAYHNKKVHPVWYILAGILIILSISAGMILAYMIFLYFHIVLPVLNRKNTRVKVLVTLGIIVLTAVVFIFWDSILTFIVSLLNWDALTQAVARITRKTGSRSGGNFITNFIEDRQMQRIFDAPYYFLYGCGEGMHERFLSISGEYHEIHSSIIALWYYYGIVPYIFFVKWLKDNLKGTPVIYWGVFIATILEAFTLINHRQPFFWMLFVLGCILVRRKQEEGQGLLIGNGTDSGRERTESVAQDPADGNEVTGIQQGEMS